MNILLTTFFYDNPIPFRAFYDHMCNWFLNTLPQEKINCKFLITENYYTEATSNYEISEYNPILISDKDLNNIFGEKKLDRKYLTQKVIYNNFSEFENKKFKDLIMEKLSSWEPDIILSQGYISGKNLFGSIFPNALCLSTENAIFSRPPFGRTISYDPYNSIPDNCLTRFTKEISSFPITKKQHFEIEKFRKELISIINKHSELDEIMRHYKKKFKKLVLLPLVGDIYIELFQDSIYKTELELVEKVLQNVPEKVGVFITQADSYASLTPENIKYFSDKYPNFIYLQKTDIRGYSNNSLHYFKYIDAVINITSKTVFMALLWNIPVLSLAKTFNNWLKDGQGMEELDKVLDKRHRNNKNNITYWYFTRYVLPEEDFLTQNYLFDYLEDKLKYYRKHGIDFEYFNQINDIKHIHQIITKQVREYYGIVTFQERLTQLYDKLTGKFYIVKNVIVKFLKKVYIFYKIVKDQ